MQKLGQYLLSNNLAMCLAVVGCILIPYFPFNVFAAILVALITLQRGAKTGLGALAWALLPSIATNIKFEQMIALAMHYDFAFIGCLLAFVFAVSLRYFRSWSRVLDIAGLIAVASLLLVAVLPLDIVGLVLLKLKAYSVEVISQAMQVKPQALSAFNKVPNLFLLGAMYASVSLMGLISIALARVWQLNINVKPVANAPQEKRAEFYHIRMGRFAASLAALVIMVGFFTKVVFLMALLPVAFVILAFAGFSLVRFMVATKAKSALAIFATMVVTFLLILFVPQLALAALTILCIADSWIDLRRFKIFSIERVNG